mgnify:FL=1
MKGFLFFCSCLLFLSLAELPIGYYTLLRIIVTIGAIIVVVTEFQNGNNFWVLTFGLIAFLFNPIIPIYLNDKSAWMPLDIISGIIFIIKSFTIKQSKI